MENETRPIATFILDLPTSPTGAIGKLYKLSKNGSINNEYVVVSSVFAFDTSQEETLIFAADETGKIIDWNDLPGSYRGGMDHELALQNAGYKIKGILN